MSQWYFLYGVAVFLHCLATPIRADFDANSTQNLFVYFSQSSGRNASLNDLCTNAAVDVVIIGFVRSFTGTAGYPTIDFGPANCNETRTANATEAPGLAVCEELGQKVKKCQDLGKKVFLSIGGSSSQTSFEAGKVGRTDAKKAARSMWDLFGGGKKVPSLRPFGRDVIVDGFDIDYEQGPPDNYDSFVSALRSYLNTGSKPMYISAAPLCTRKNATISGAVLALVDFIFIRFYNAAACSFGTPGFSDSLNEWYEYIVPSPNLSVPKVLLGGLSFDNGNAGYISAESFKSAIRAAKRPEFMCQCWNEDKFGGVMLWDGPRGLENKAEGGLDFLTSVKNGLTEE